MSEPMTAIRHVTIRGRVQGVGYRAFVDDVARRRGLEGWVRNRRDGSVEAVFAGPPDDVAQMIAECHSGPSLARVETVNETPADAALLDQRPAGQRFAVLPTL